MASPSTRPTPRWCTPSRRRQGIPDQPDRHSRSRRLRRGRHQGHEGLGRLHHPGLRGRGHHAPDRDRHPPGPEGKGQAGTVHQQGGPPGQRAEGHRAGDAAALRPDHHRGQQEDRRPICPRTSGRSGRSGSRTAASPSAPPSTTGPSPLPT